MQTADQLKFLMDRRVNNKRTSEPTSRQQKFWIVVYFPAEDAVSHPIRLQEVETLMGDTGEQAGLREGDTCLAPYFVGDRLHTAKIIRCIGNRVELLQEYAKFLNLRRKTDGDFLTEEGEDMMEQNTAENEGRPYSIWKYAKAVGGGIAVGGLTVVAAPLVLSAGGVSAVVAATVMTKAVPVIALTAAGSVAVKEMVTEDEHSSECTKTDKESKSTKTTSKTMESSQTSQVTAKKNSGSMLSGAGLRSAVQGVFSWFSGTSEDDEEKDPPRADSGENSTEENAVLIDLSEDVTLNSSPRRNTPVSSTQNKTLTTGMEDNDRDWLTLENQRLWEERVCKICKDGEVAVLFDPCGHMCACLDCSAVQRRCPMCSQFISVHHRVYRS